MVVNTKRLFIQLLRTLRINIVCDIGSMNGAEALLFRAAAPAADIYAMEAHPDNARRMQDDPRLQANRISIVAMAAADRDGEADFFMTPQGYAGGDTWRGMSSLHRRTRDTETLTTTRVRTTRLDNLLADRLPSKPRLALWIDTEGKTYEVLVGAAGIIAQTQLLHLEVETAPYIGTDQKLYSDVKAALRAMDFAELATDRRPDSPQFNALFVRNGLPRAARLQIAVLLTLARMHRLLAQALRLLCPACLRRYQQHRQRKTINLQNAA